MLRNSDPTSERSWFARPLDIDSTPSLAPVAVSTSGTSALLPMVSIRLLKGWVALSGGDPTAPTERLWPLERTWRRTSGSGTAGPGTRVSVAEGGEVMPPTTEETRKSCAMPLARPGTVTPRRVETPSVWTVQMPAADGLNSMT